MDRIRKEIFLRIKFIMLYSEKIQKAVKFSIKTHEVYKKQKRKGKDIAYITHPLTVGLILSLAGADEDVIVAGILHDTAEDSLEEKKVTMEMIAERFGERVAGIVMSVTEKNKELPWDVRKKIALEHIAGYDRDSLMLKSADVINNGTELVDDHKKHGDKVFKNFNAPKDKLLRNQLAVIGAILKRWPENPLRGDLDHLLKKLQMIKDETC
jgi:(p)ppGpp synthase/HD superfamily hydrolase